MLYYQYWEAQVYSALTHMMASAMRDFQRVMTLFPAAVASAKRAAASAAPTDDADASVTCLACIAGLPLPHSAAVGACQYAAPAQNRMGDADADSSSHAGHTLIHVSAATNGASIILAPRMSDISKLLDKQARDIATSTGRFVRWMHGTCLECGPENKTKITVTFEKEIVQHPLVVQSMIDINQALTVDEFKESWTGFNKAYDLWDPKGLAKLDHLKSQDVSAAFIDAKLSELLTVIDRMNSVKPEYDLCFMQIDCSSLVQAVKDQAEFWMHKFYDLLYEKASTELHDIANDIEQLSADVARPIDDRIDDLKMVLHTISEVNSKGLEMTLRFRSVQEKYHTLVRFDKRRQRASGQKKSPFALDDDDDDAQVKQSAAGGKQHKKLKNLKPAEDLDDMWRELVVRARRRDAGLHRVRKRFTRVTEDDVVN